MRSEKPARVLVVDDNRALVQVMAGVLERQGYEVLTAYDGLHGLAKAQKEDLDLLILDVVMPGMDGYEVCARLHASADTADLPVLFLTIKGSIDERRGPRGMDARLRERLDGFEVGALEFLTKPVSAALLLERARSLIWYGREHRPPRPQPARVPESRESSA
jgi:DNA-binding response OmpR family regulator